VLAKYTHSPLAPDDILEAEITSNGVQNGLAKSAGKFQYLKDALGTVTDIADPNGNIVQRYDYSSYGKILSIKDVNALDITASPSINTSFTFTGREWDEDAGLFYYRARYYDANIGRFLQQDPDPGKLANPISIANKYAYASNAPTVYTDPTGKFLFLAFLIPLFTTIAYSAAIGAVVGGVISGLIAAQHGNFWTSFGQGFAAGAVQGAISGAIFGAATFGFGAAMAAAFPSISAATVEAWGGGVFAVIGAAQGARYGLPGILIGATAGYIGGTLGAGAGMSAWQGAAGAAIGPGSALEPTISPFDPVVPTIDDFQKPPPKQAPFPVGPRG
jgi:RHS repeat-associated protein